jgi:hypothetical protein
VKCWICGRETVVDTDGNGAVREKCPKCWPIIEHHFNPLHVVTSHKSVTLVPERPKYCQSPGCLNRLVYVGFGRPSIYCPEHRSMRSRKFAVRARGRLLL